MKTRPSPDPEIIGPTDGHEERVRARFWKTVRKAVAAIPFIDEVIAAYYCAFDPETPTSVRATLLAALAYFVLPFDLVPDFLLGMGFVDDASILLAAITAVQQHIGDRHREAARVALDRLAAENAG